MSIDLRIAIFTEGLAFLVTLILTGSYFVAKNNSNKYNITFFFMCTTNLTALGFDLITWILEGTKYTAILYISNFMIFSLGYVIEALFTRYLSYFIKEEHAVDRMILAAVYVSCGSAILLVILSVFNHMYFFVEDGILVSGWMPYPSILFTLFIIILDETLVWLHHTELGMKTTAVFLLYGAVPALASIVQLTGVELTVTWLGSTLTLLLIFVFIHEVCLEDLKEKEQKLSEVSSLLVLSQIRSHFLFNVLNSIYELCDLDPKRAQEAVGEFSEYLRGNLSVLDQAQLIPFEAEMGHLEHYLSLEKMRFGDQIQIEYDITVSDFQLPALSVQPIVENSIKHGLKHFMKNIHIKIITEECDSCYQITVQDDGVGFCTNKFYPQSEQDLDDIDNSECGKHDHVGLRNVRMRLESVCGGRLELFSVQGEGTTVTITIPKERK